MSTVSKEKPSFDDITAKLPQAYKDEIIETDRYLKALRPLKFKRTIDKNAEKITYAVSDYGVSYIFYISAEKPAHKFQWYIVTNCKPEQWYRKADYMEETLAYIAKSDAPLSARIYNALKTR